MDKPKALWMVGLSGAGAAAGYLLAKKKGRKKNYKPVLIGALAGAVAGIAINKFMAKDTEEVKLSLNPGSIEIERS